MSYQRIETDPNNFNSAENINSQAQAAQMFFVNSQSMGYPSQQAQPPSVGIPINTMGMQAPGN